MWDSVFFPGILRHVDWGSWESNQNLMSEQKDFFFSLDNIRMMLKHLNTLAR